MKTPVALFTICALTVVALGLGAGPARRDAAPVALPTLVDASAPLAVLAAPRTQALRVMPTMTVVPSAEERLAAAALDAPPVQASVMLEAAVDQAKVAITAPVSAALPRVRLGNPFYDFGRTRRTATATE
jgi:hypothetical protein